MLGRLIIYKSATDGHLFFVPVRPTDRLDLQNKSQHAFVRLKFDKHFLIDVPSRVACKCGDVHMLLQRTEDFSWTTEYETRCLKNSQVEYGDYRRTS